MVGLRHLILTALYLATSPKSISRKSFYLVVHEIRPHVNEQNSMSSECRDGIYPIYSSVCLAQQLRNTVDTWSASYPDWVNKRRIHAVEWPYLQFRNYPPSTWYSHLCHDLHSLWCLPCIYGQEWYHQIFWAQHEQPHSMARLIVTRGHQRAEFQSRRPTLCNRQRWFECADMVICRK